MLGHGFEITSDKVATLAPSWARFPGLTVLFDEEPSGEPLLYAVLADAVDALAATSTARRYGLCLLPSSTYHVTVCDGPNVRHRKALPDAAGFAFDSVIDSLPDEPIGMPQALYLLRPDRLDAVVERHPVSMRVEAVEIRDHAVVAALGAADEPSVAGLELLRRERDRYSEQLSTRLRMRATRWRPHVTVGYLANTGLAEGVRPLVNGWNRVLAERPDATATFDGASLRGFTDMTNFIRLPD